MITDLKPYPKMKDSGVEWLGEVPVHWGQKRLKSIARLRYGLGQPPRELSDGLPLIRATNVDHGRIIQKNLAYIDPLDVPKSRNAFLSKNEIIVVRSGAYTADSAIIPEAFEGAVAGYDMVVTVTGARPEFIAAALLSRYVRDDQLIIASARSAQPHLNAEELGVAVFFLPPRPEQTAIVRFLDHTDQCIRRYIRPKQKLITLLEEQKQAIIHQAVTGQIDVRTGQPYPAYKDSGVEWLGKVPVHWGQKRLKSIAHLRYGLGQPPRELSDGLPLIRATNVDHGRIIQKNLAYIDPLDVPKSRNAFLSKNEIIVVRSGAYTADSAIIPEAFEGAVAGYDMVVTVTGARPEFIAAALLSRYVRDDQLIIASARSAQPHLNAEELGVAVFFLPPRPEQTAIVRFLDQKVAKIAIALTQARREISLLQEYRARLIADVVTGKLDVREAAATILEETDVPTQVKVAGAIRLEDSTEMKREVAL